LKELNTFLDAEKVHILFYEKTNKKEEIFYILNEDNIGSDNLENK